MKIVVENDALGLAKPATRIIEILGQAGGVVGNTIFKFDAAKIIRISAAEAKAEENKLAKIRSQTEILKQQITQRLLIQQYRKQVNLNNIAAMANELIQDVSISGAEVDIDWATRFVHVAEDAFDDYIQKILANILAREATNPGASSKRLLDFLNSADKNELDLFNTFAAISSDIGLYHLSNYSSSGLSQYGLSIPNIIRLSDLGLINMNKELSVHLDFENGREIITLNKYIAQLKKDKPSHIELGIIPLTNLGEQLYRFTRPYADNPKITNYIHDFREHLIKRQLDVDIIKRTD